MSDCFCCHESINAIFDLRRCHHRVCHKCMVTYLKNLTSAKVKCPVKECTKNLADNVIRECLSNSQIKKYDNLCHPVNLFKCLIEDCPFVISVISNEIQFQCPICGQPNCLQCGTLHYPHQNCFETNQTPFKHNALKCINNIKRKEIEVYDDSNDLIPNPEGFECSICTCFILPRKGVSLRNCLHTFCRECLKSTFENYNFINQLSCSICSSPLKERERRFLLGNDRLLNLSINAVKTKFFNCKEPNCDAMWDVEDFQGKHRCPKCKKENCIACEFVHEGISCDKFKQTDTFKTMKCYQKKLLKENGVSCINCKRFLIKKKGCGALKCDKCNINICLFTGKLVGKEGCNCTSEKPCHKDCIYGCIPE